MEPRSKMTQLKYIADLKVVLIVQKMQIKLSKVINILRFWYSNLVKQGTQNTYCMNLF